MPHCNAQYGQWVAVEAINSSMDCQLLNAYHNFIHFRRRSHYRAGQDSIGGRPCHGDIRYELLAETLLQCPQQHIGNCLIMFACACFRSTWAYHTSRLGEASVNLR
jgi:hypothetical protein